MRLFKFELNRFEIILDNVDDEIFINGDYNRLSQE